MKHINYTTVTLNNTSQQQRRYVCIALLYNYIGGDKSQNNAAKLSDLNHNHRENAVSRMAAP